MRFPMDVPVAFWWQNASGEGQQGEGRAYDVSESGAFILASPCPPIGAYVNVKIPISQIPNAPQHLRVEMDGRVIRVEQNRNGHGRDGFAIVSDQVVLREGASSSNRREFIN
jgi:hypothetical protein